ncbi:HAD family hydrolase [Anaerosacchariphilus polymeriproducens]|nr:HAD family hydrolase [Anaerosacchariphilus polymeriproducens]
MKKPKMIIFDYGNTLVKETIFNSKKGIAALEKYFVFKNNKVDLDRLAEFSDKMFLDLVKKALENGVEIHNISCLKFMFEYFEVECSLNYIEMEKIFWDHAASGIKMDYVDEVLEYLKKHNIRTGIISNISFSRENVLRRINEIFKNNSFEFIVTSSEYVYRKPNRLIFELGLKKAGLNANDVWYCGDNFNNDILGASATGIFPVYFDSCNKSNNEKNNIEYLYITSLKDLISNLEEAE